MPAVLKAIANWNPVSAVTQACRQLFGNTGRQPLPHSPWSLHHPIIYTLIWIVGLLAVFVPLCVRRYKRAASR
jgi:ABC-2 type transport system permease protein